MNVDDTYHQIREALGRLFYIIPPHPEVAQIEVTNVCNFDCAMCQRKHLGVAERHMDYGVFCKIVDRLDGVKSTILCGWGEPLCHPRIIDMVKYAKGRGLRVSLTSNGSLLDGKMRDALIDSGIDSVSFSIDDTKAEGGPKGHAVGSQLDNIAAFMERIKARGSRLRVILQATYHKNGEDKILRVMEYAAKNGIREVNVNRLDVRFNNLPRPAYAEEKAFVDRMLGKADRLGVNAEFRCHTAYGGLRRVLARMLIPLFHERGMHCLRVYNYVYVTVDGHVTPCCALPGHRVGNMLTEDLAEIWSGEAFERFRESEFQRKVCGRCDVLEIRPRDAG